MREIPSAELAVIIGKLSKHDPDLDAVSSARHRYQLQMLLARLSGSQLEEIASAVADDRKAKESGALSSILASLTEKDADRALDWVAAQENSSALLSIVISQMAENDPVRASELFREGLMEGNINGSNVWQASQGISRAMAKLGALPLLEFMDTLPGRYRTSVIYSTIGSLPDGEEKILLDEFYKRSTDDMNRGNQLEYLFSHALGKNTGEAEAWLKTLPDGKDKISLQTAAARKSIQNGDVEDARKWMVQAFEASPGKEKEVFINATQKMGYNDPEGIAKLAGTLPPGIELTAEDLKQSANQSLHIGLGSLAAVVNAIRNPDEKVKLITETLDDFSNSGSGYRNTGTTDFEILSRRISEMGLTGGNLEKVTMALESARQGVNR